MAPLQAVAAVFASRLLPAAHHSNFLTRRDGSDDYEGSGEDDTHLLYLMIISISLASVSVLAALSAFYWFIRMRRSFRQDLIMLLIQSDMLKALWLMICPLAYFAGANMKSDSTFCQVSGIFLTIAIDASDMAVLLIAIHTALYILGPTRAGVAAGLHPYRYVAYFFWLAIPVILAAILPFTHDGTHYNGAHCWLPRPTWYHSNVSWIPRYIVFGVIIVVYVIVYLYVYLRFQRFGRDQRRASTSLSDQTPQRRKRNKSHSREVPPTPPIADHGLLSSNRASVIENRIRKGRRHSVASDVSTLRLGEEAGTVGQDEGLQFGEEATLGEGLQLGEETTNTTHGERRKTSLSWNLVDFSLDGPVRAQIGPRPSGDDTTLNPIEPTSSTSAAEHLTPLRAPEPTYHPERAYNAESDDVSNDVSTSNPSPNHEDQPQPQPHPSIWKQPGHSIANSFSTMITALRRGPPRPTTPSPSDLDEICLAPEETAATMRRSRYKMQRQLRLLFVYPLVYLVTWVAPFVSHVLRYDDYYYSSSSYSSLSVMQRSSTSTIGHREPFGLQAVSIASLCIGAAVDCAFFSAWEKPWLHLTPSAGFRTNLARRLRVRTPAERRRGGRTSEEREADARRAYVRREHELLQAEAEAAMRRDGNARRREWWDVVDVEAGVGHSPFDV
ncbi:G protein-coupled glucose receptor regulating Gpa2-domain-containing protein [Xylariomycetidae sp. FL0641]|nr:G protein-coupled glucose receptor regulating Gpa2-domain-containing protein [Xylariomycetidae sp. FL0641]